MKYDIEGILFVVLFLINVVDYMINMLKIWLIF